MEHKDTLMWKELSSAPAALSALEERNAAALAAIAAEVKAEGIHGIYTAARGTSDHAMIYLKYLAETLLHIPAASGAPSVFTMYSSYVDLSGCLVIGCSQSGKAADVAEVIRAANACGAITVAITNDEGSPLAHLAKHHLCCFAGEEKSVAATKTFTCQLMLCLLLVNAIRGAATADAGAKLKAIAGTLDALAEETAARIGSASGCFVLGRGVTSAIAYECALKLQETSYMMARAYHSSDFYHGPMAMISEGMPVLLYASRHSLDSAMDDDHTKDYVACAGKMTELGADLYVITDNPDAFEGINATCAAVPTIGNEEEQAMAFAMFAQMLACKVSVAKGNNPDSPRALKKVTITK